MSEQPDLLGDPVYRDAVTDLLGVLAYAELIAFERLAYDARMAPTLEDKAALAQLATAEFGHYQLIERHLDSIGIAAEKAMAPFVVPLEAFHAKTAPSDWEESLVKAYVGDGIAADFYREIARLLDPLTREVVLEVLADSGHAEFAVERVRQRTPKLLSARAMVLGVVALLAFVLVYPTLHSYLAEKTAVDALRARVAAAQQQNDDLDADLARWDDPAYITAQARERLSFVMPGETAWRVVDPETVPGEAPDPVVAPTAAPVPDAPWYGTVWQSIQAADQSDDEPTGQPTTPAP